ncbi:hypothetical protein SAMN02910453_0674 [Lachnospiraceae bacterium A10]|nr:hypothetical protein SAMN02910453_0674 [Lachnospiraceae bacterium A10]
MELFPLDYASDRKNQNYAGILQGSRNYTSVPLNTNTKAKDCVNISKEYYKSKQVEEQFLHSAYVYRAVERGYVEVNGQRIEFSEETKEKLKIAAEDVRKRNEAAHACMIAEHNQIVAKQQADAMMSTMKKEMKALSIASRMSSGRKVSEAERKFLMQTDPELYMRALMAEMMAKQKKRHEEEVREEKIEDDETVEENEDYMQEINEITGDFKEVTLAVAMEGDGITVGDVGIESL